MPPWDGHATFAQISHFALILSPKETDFCKRGHDPFARGNATQPAGTAVCSPALLKNACLGLVVLLPLVHFPLNSQACLTKQEPGFWVAAGSSRWKRSWAGKGKGEGS